MVPSSSRRKHVAPARASAALHAVDAPAAAAPAARGSAPAWAAFVSCLAMGVGWHWDISWHRSVGRDTIWTPPHVAIYVALALAVAYNLSLVWSFSFGARRLDPSVRVLGLRAPAGTFITLWSVLIQAAAFLFDKWWHESYGIDAAVSTPPHAFLGLGVDVFFFGQIVLVASLANTTMKGSRAAEWLVASLIALTMGHMYIGLDPLFGPLGMRSFAFTVSGAVLWPFMLAVSHEALRWKWGMLATAELFMGEIVVLMQATQLLPATPKFGPVYHHVEHLLPPPFPILLVVPALVLTLAWSRAWPESRLLSAAMSGVLFMTTFIAVNWALATVLLGPLGDNRFFAGHLPPAAFVEGLRQTRILAWDRASFVLVAVTFVVASISIWSGRGVGRWMRGVVR